MTNIAKTSLNLTEIVKRLNTCVGTAKTKTAGIEGEWHFKLDVDFITLDESSGDFDGCLHIELSDDPDFEGGLGRRHTVDNVDFLICSAIPSDLAKVLEFYDDDSDNLCARYQLSR